jgi:hypothetical protein
LGTALQHLWLMQYVPLLHGRQAFWRRFSEFLGQWLRAMAEQGGPEGAELHSADAGAMQRLAERGSPLKVCCAAACTLAGREAEIAPLAAAIDHLLAGAVLVDHVQDWEEDLAAGRYNALVAYLSPRKQEANDRDVRRQAVLEELYLGDAAHPYFELAQRQFQRALVGVRAVQVPQLEKYLAWAEAETERYAHRLAAEFSARLRVAVEGLVSSSTEREQAEIDPYKEAKGCQELRSRTILAEER